MNPIEGEPTMNPPDKEHKIPQIEKVTYTARSHTTGGRDGGASRTSDGRLDVKLSIPGTPAPGKGTSYEVADFGHGGRGKAQLLETPIATIIRCGSQVNRVPAEPWLR
jgi:hypothetical protein